jgi:hypothetical protein
MMGKFAMYTAPLTLTLWMLENNFLDDVIGKAMGDEYKDMLRSIPEHDKTSYHCVPLSWADKAQGKVLYFRMPLEEGERMMNGILRKSLTSGEGGSGILNYAGGQLPGGNPVLEVGLAWFTYKIAGDNPYDPFRGNHVVRPDEYEAGLGDEAMLKWSWNSLGGGIITRLGDKSIFEPEPGALEKFLSYPGISNLLGRWLKVSNRGLVDDALKITEPVRKYRAEARVVGMAIVKKLVNGEELTADQKTLMLSEDYLAEYVYGKLSQVLTSQDLDPEMRQLMNSKSNEEKAALVDHYFPNDTLSP